MSATATRSRSPNVAGASGNSPVPVNVYNLPLTASWVAAQMGGAVAAGDAAREFSGVSIDTRTLKTGEVYVGVRGERFDGADAQRWRDAGFKLVEPDGGHVMHGIFEWMASPARSGKCLVFKMGKGNVLPKLQLCQPPYSYAICEPDKVIKFDARRIGALRSELLAAGLQACEKWFAYSRLVAEVATLVNELDSPRSRNLLNARSLELSKLSALFPKNLVLPRPGTDPQLILSAVLNKDPMRLAPTPSQPGCTSQSPSFDR